MAKTSRIGRFEIVEVLGRGASGTVYRCKGADGQGLVAVKCFEGVRVPANWLEQFKNRARLAARLTDPCLVRVLGAGNHNNSPYVAMELLQGTRLDERLRISGPLPITDALVVAESIASVLDEAAAMGIDHYDIRTCKIALDGEGTAKVLDVGILKPGTNGLASPTYASPEQVLGRPLDVRSQIYSLGIVLYELLEGRPPFKAAGLEELSRMHLSSIPPALEGRSSQLPQAVLQLLAIMLAKEPNDRFSDFHALAQHIDAALQSMEGAATVISASVEPSITSSFTESDLNPELEEDATILAGPARGPVNARTQKQVVSSGITAEFEGEDFEPRGADQNTAGMVGQGTDDFPSLRSRRPRTASMAEMADLEYANSSKVEAIALCLVVTSVGLLGSVAWWALGVN